jgi:hypothetical protein
VRGYKVDAYERFTILLVADKVQSVINPREDPGLLRSPCGAHDAVWELHCPVTQSRRLDLGEKAAKLADDVGALKIDGQLLKVPDPVASRASGMPAYGDLPSLPEILSSCGHEGTILREQSDLLTACEAAAIGELHRMKANFRRSECYALSL